MPLAFILIAHEYSDLMRMYPRSMLVCSMKCPWAFYYIPVCPPINKRSSLWIMPFTCSNDGFYFFLNLGQAVYESCYLFFSQIKILFMTIISITPQLRIITWQSRVLKALFSCSPLFLIAVSLTEVVAWRAAVLSFRLVPGSNPGSRVWYPRLYDWGTPSAL